MERLPVTNCLNFKVSIDNLYLVIHERRTGTEHREQGLLFYTERNQRRQSELFDRTGTRFSEFIGLPFFDAPRMTIIDPMHCCFFWYVTSKPNNLRPQFRDSGAPRRYFIFRDRQVSMAARMDHNENISRRETPSGGKREIVFANDWVKHVSQP